MKQENRKLTVSLRKCFRDCLPTYFLYPGLWLLFWWFAYKMWLIVATANLTPSTGLEEDQWELKNMRFFPRSHRLKSRVVWIMYAFVYFSSPMAAWRWVLCPTNKEIFYINLMSSLAVTLKIGLLLLYIISEKPLYTLLTNNYPIHPKSQRSVDLSKVCKSDHGCNYLWYSCRFFYGSS